MARIHFVEEVGSNQTEKRNIPLVQSFLLTLSNGRCEVIE
jgi:hypothetical protein